MIESSMAWVEWDRVAQADLPASASEAAVLALAGELAGVPSGQSLRILLATLDDANTALVLRAVLHTHHGRRPTR